MDPLSAYTISGVHNGSVLKNICSDHIVSKLAIRTDITPDIRKYVDFVTFRVGKSRFSFEFPYISTLALSPGRFSTASLLAHQTRYF